MRSEIAEKYARQVAVCLFRRNFDGARSVIAEAEDQELGRGGWDQPLENLGLDPMTVHTLGRAGLYTPRDIEHETLESLQEIYGISKFRAGEIVKVMANFTDTVSQNH